MFVKKIYHYCFYPRQEDDCNELGFNTRSPLLARRSFDVNWFVPVPASLLLIPELRLS